MAGILFFGMFLLGLSGCIDSIHEPFSSRTGNHFIVVFNAVGSADIESNLPEGTVSHIVKSVAITDSRDIDLPGYFAEAKAACNGHVKGYVWKGVEVSLFGASGVSGLNELFGYSGEVWIGTDLPGGGWTSSGMASTFDEHYNRIAVPEGMGPVALDLMTGDRTDDFPVKFQAENASDSIDLHVGIEIKNKISSKQRYSTGLMIAFDIVPVCDEHPSPGDWTLGLVGQAKFNTGNAVPQGAEFNVWYVNIGGDAAHPQSCPDRESVQASKVVDKLGASGNLVKTAGEGTYSITGLVFPLAYTGDSFTETVRPEACAPVQLSELDPTSSGVVSFASMAATPTLCAAYCVSAADPVSCEPACQQIDAFVGALILRADAIKSIQEKTASGERAVSLEGDYVFSPGGHSSEPSKK